MIIDPISVNKSLIFYCFDKFPHHISNFPSCSFIKVSKFAPSAHLFHPARLLIIRNFPLMYTRLFHPAPLLDSREYLINSKVEVLATTK